MDNLDKQILTQLQYNFPLNVRPYHTIAEKLNIDVATLWQRVEKLLADGVIRRVGASLDSYELGFSSTLAAIRIKPEKVDQAEKVIEKHHEITHSYLRDDAFNVWFTIIAQDDEHIEAVLDSLKQKLSLESSDILNLPLSRRFKLDARFKSS